VTGVRSSGPEGKWTAQLEAFTHDVRLVLNDMLEQEIQDTTLRPTAVHLKWTRRDTSPIPRLLTITVQGEWMHRGQVMPVSPVHLETTSDELLTTAAAEWPEWLHILAVAYAPQGWDQ
jgi:hypothetical protein